MSGARIHLLILGGGLAGGIAALALAKRCPELRISIVERDATLGGNHLWSFFASDVERDDLDILEPLIERRWPGYDVRFPDHRRTLRTAYHSMTSERLDRAVRAALGNEAIVHGDVVEAWPTYVKLADGRKIEADAVIDMRGLCATPEGVECGAQKFVGRMMRVVGGHGVERPVVMDATVSQTDGYRFVYLLPFSETDIFVEDTYYRTDMALDIETLATRIDHYCQLQGWDAEPAGRMETGVLPVVTGGDPDIFWRKDSPVARGGVRAGLFHHLTSYSVPDAMRFANWLCNVMPLDGDALAKRSRSYAVRHWKEQRFDRMLARMLFNAAEPAERYRVLQRFYRLPSSLIERFYAGRTTVADRLRILAGKPPVPITRAVRAILGKA